MTRDQILQMQQLFDEAPVAYHEIDLEGRIVRSNAAECALLGRTREELIGLPVWELICPEERETARLAVEAKLHGSQPLSPFCRTYQRSDGTQFIAEIREKRILDPDGRLLGMRSALLDVTAQMQREQSLRESEHWLAMTLRSLDAGLVAADSLGTIKFMNQEAERLTGWAEPEALGSDLTQVVRIAAASNSSIPRDRVFELFFHLGPCHISGRFLLIPRSGESRPIDLKVAPIAQENQVVTGVVVLFSPPGENLPSERIPAGGSS